MSPAPPRAFERAFGTITVMLLSGAVVQALMTGHSALNDPAAGNRAYQVLMGLAYVAALLLLLKHRRLVAAVRAIGWLPVLLVVLVMASVSWSVMPDITLQRGSGLAGTVLLGAYFAERYGATGFLRILALGLTTAALLGLAAAVVAPEVAFHADLHAGMWRGVYVHKNVAGSMLGLGAVACFVAGSLGAARIPWAAAGFLTCALGTALSGSRSAWVASCAAVAIVMGMRSRRHAAAGFAVTVILALYVFAGAQPTDVISTGLQTLGRDESLTGRLPLWTESLLAAAERPWLGHGYRAFWFDELGGASGVWRAVRWIPRHSHNSAVEMVVDLGVIGLVWFTCFLGLFIARTSRGFLWARAIATQAAALGTFVWLESFSDATVPGPNSLGFVILIVLTTGLMPRQREAHRPSLYRMTPDDATPGVAPAAPAPLASPGRARDGGGAVVAA